MDKKKHGNKDCQGCGATLERGIDFCPNYKEWWNKELEKMEREDKENCSR